MAQVLPAEHDLRRVIGDDEGTPDREVEGLSDDDLLDLYRSLVLLRTYDERSLVYHRQGRIGTYAIFWGHEAIQVGAAHALDDDDWIFPSYRESAIGLIRGMPPATILSWWRGHPAGWWNPADYNVASICVPIATHVPHAAGLAWGKNSAASRRSRWCSSATARPPRAHSTRGRTSPPSCRPRWSSSATTTTWAISTPLEAQTAAETLADKAVGYGMPGVRVDGTDVLAVHEAARGRRARALGRRPDLHRGGDVSRRTARDGRRSERVHRPRAGRGRAPARMRRPLRRLSAPRRDPLGRPRRRDQGRGGGADAARGSRMPRPSRPAGPSSSSSTPTRVRPRRSRATSPS